MAYDAPEAASEDLKGRAAQAASGLPEGAGGPPTMEQVESVTTPDAPADHGAPGAASGTTIPEPATGPAGVIPGVEADKVQLEGANLPDEEQGRGLTGGPIGN